MSGKSLIFLLLFFPVLLLTSCDSRPVHKYVPSRGAEKPSYGDTLVDGTIGEPSNLIPLLSADSASHEVASLIFNGLLKYDKNLNLVGDLAESWEVSDNGLILTFHLRRGVKWHDGAEFTSRDVLYTYRVTIDPKTPTAYAEDFKQVKLAEAPDPYTFRATYGKPFAPALASWGSAILPAHLLEGKDITKSPLSRIPVGTGPYRFKEWIAGQKLLLSLIMGISKADLYRSLRLPNHPDVPPCMELKSGGLDMMATPVSTSARPTPRPSRSVSEISLSASSYVYRGYNLRHPYSRTKGETGLTSAIDKAELSRVFSAWDRLPMGRTNREPGPIPRR
jgi:peptide/nickel transport system substrate-binding protein